MGISVKDIQEMRNMTNFSEIYLEQTVNRNNEYKELRPSGFQNGNVNDAQEEDGGTLSWPSSRAILSRQTKTYRRRPGRYGREQVWKNAR